MEFTILLQALYLLIPAYFANMAPVFAFNLFPSMKPYPLDFGLQLGKKRILGDHKTINGVITGVALAVVVSFLQSMLDSNPFFHSLAILDYDEWLLIGILSGAGALLGDSIKSFFKRRSNIKPGQRWIPFDQLDFVLGSLFAIGVVYPLQIDIVLVSLAASFFLHIAVNHMGYHLKMRKTPW